MDGAAYLLIQADNRGLGDGLYPESFTGITESTLAKEK